MKKKYETPETMFVVTELPTMVCTSGGVVGEGTADDIDYGGVDEDGDKNPASRRQNAWDDEEVEEIDEY